MSESKELNALNLESIVGNNAQMIYKVFKNKKFKSLETFSKFAYMQNKLRGELEWVQKYYGETNMAILFNALEKLSSYYVENFGSSFDEEELNKLNINDVLEALGLEKRGSKFLCPNNHESNKVTVQIHQNNICKCHNCNQFQGGPISVATWMYNGDFIQACDFLHSHFNIPYKSQSNATVQQPIAFAGKKVAHKETEYIRFDSSKEFVKTNFKNYLPKYEEMKDEQKFKMIVTAIYHFSLQTKQWGKENYYKSRRISFKINPELKEKVLLIKKYVGYIHNADIKDLIKHLTDLFPVGDLVKFGVLNGYTHKRPLSFKHATDEGFCVIPNFDLYTSMCTGLKLRNTKLQSWQDSGMKEPELSYGRIANPLPFALTRDAMLNENINFRFTEGSVDMFSLPAKEGFCDIAIPGVHGIDEKQLGLFKGRTVELWFDQDSAGQNSAYGYYEYTIEENGEETKKTFTNKNFSHEDIKARFKVVGYTYYKGLKEKLEKAGATVVIKTWNIALGSDLNEVLQNGNILKIKDI